MYVPLRGGVTQRKGIKYLLEAWRRVRRPGWRLQLLGPLPSDPGPLVDYLGEVEHLGCVSHAEMPSRMAVADVFVFPSLFEGSAVVTYEALACGLPSIVTPAAGSVANDGIEGFVVPAGDVDCLAEVMSRLGEDPGLRGRMAVAARTRAEAFDWPRYHAAVTETVRADDPLRRRPHPRRRSTMELNYVFGTAAVMLGLFTIQVVTRRFDPFAPIWLFLVGYFQVYVVQAISFHEWAVNVRGEELVGLANQRALWSLVLFLLVYYSGLGRLFAPLLPRPPAQWSTSSINLISPVFIIWGLVCSGVLLRSEDSSAADLSPEAALLRSFPFLMLVAANLLIVTGAPVGSNRPTYLWMGVTIAAAYVFIWMFNGKRSHSLDRCALGRLRFLYRAAEAAIVASPDVDGFRRRLCRRRRHRLA